MTVNLFTRRMALNALVSMALVPVGIREVFSETPTAKSAGSLTVRLVNVTIPPDSRLRNLTTINRPPLLYLQLYEDGTLIGTSSTVTYGWETDYACFQIHGEETAVSSSRYLRPCAKTCLSRMKMNAQLHWRYWLPTHMS